MRASGTMASRYQVFNQYWLPFDMGHLQAEKGKVRYQLDRARVMYGSHYLGALSSFEKSMSISFSNCKMGIMLTPHGK